MNKKRLLIVSKKIPYPLSQGGTIAQFFFLQKLTTVFDVSFCTGVFNKNQEKNLEDLKKEIPQIEFFVFKALNEDIITLPIVNTFIKSYYKLKKRFKFKILNLYSKNGIGKNINELDNNFNYEGEDFLSFFSGLVKNQNFDIIQLEFFETISLLSIIPENIKTIFVHHEVRSKRNSLIKTINPIYGNYIKSITLIIENALLSIADNVIVFNEEDKFFLKTVDSNVLVSPFGIPKSLIIKKQSSVYFNRFVFIGSEFHFPNKEGLEWFLTAIFSPNTEVINWPIYITGFWSESFKNKYVKNKKIIFTDYVQSLDLVYENSVLIAPILSGSGVRTKILEALANRVPVICTPFASEGLYKKKEPLNHIIHFNSSLDFQEIFDKINGQNDFLIKLADNGFEYFFENFNEDNLFEKRLTAYFD